MIKDKFNTILREFVKNEVSLRESDRNFVSNIYRSFTDLLGDTNTLQIGSYPRFTAIRPLHDLDILYIIGDWNEQNHSPQKSLEELLMKIKNDYINPTDYEIESSLQSHSVTVSFKDDSNEEFFSIDIVPAYVFSINEFHQDTYKVPEILRKKHGKNRKEFYKKLLKEQRKMGWIHTDPRGYIEITKQVNKSNDDFRKTVKFIKAWKNSCEEKYDDFKLDSFHIEQVITKYFQENSNLEIFDSIFNFFVELPEIIQSPKIEDRANAEKYIDAYLNNLTEDQKNKIIQARDCFLKKLEEFSEENSVSELVDGCFYKRASNSEQFLFDFKIPVLTDDEYSFEIYGEVQERNGGFRKYILDKIGLISIDRKIKFKIKGGEPNVNLFKWKVKNDNNSDDPRGEINNHTTKNDPENTKFKGEHYVECYAILNNVCVAKARQNVKLN